jgi:hypothetical protein
MSWTPGMHLYLCHWFLLLADHLRALVIEMEMSQLLPLFARFEKDSKNSWGIENANVIVHLQNRSALAAAFIRLFHARSV